MDQRRAAINGSLTFLLAWTVVVGSYGQGAIDNELESVARQIISEVRYAGFTTIDSLGYPNTRTMDALPPGDHFQVWLATNPASRKVRQIEKNSAVALYYSQSEKGNYVTLIGKASLIDDPESKAKYWRDDWEEFYPTKQDMLLIKVEPVRLEVVSYEHGIVSESKDWKAPETIIQTN